MKISTNFLESFHQAAKQRRISPVPLNVWHRIEAIMHFRCQLPGYDDTIVARSLPKELRNELCSLLDTIAADKSLVYKYSVYIRDYMSVHNPAFFAGCLTNQEIMGVTQRLFNKALKVSPDVLCDMLEDTELAFPRVSFPALEKLLTSSRRGSHHRAARIQDALATPLLRWLDDDVVIPATPASLLQEDFFRRYRLYRNEDSPFLTNPNTVWAGISLSKLTGTAKLDPEAVAKDIAGFGELDIVMRGARRHNPIDFAEGTPIDHYTVELSSRMHGDILKTPFLVFPVLMFPEDYEYYRFGDRFPGFTKINDRYALHTAVTAKCFTKKLYCKLHHASAIVPGVHGGLAALNAETMFYEYRRRGYKQLQKGITTADDPTDFLSCRFPSHQAPIIDINGIDSAEFKRYKDVLRELGVSRPKSSAKTDQVEKESETMPNLFANSQSQATDKKVEDTLQTYYDQKEMEAKIAEAMPDIDAILNADTAASAQSDQDTKSQDTSDTGDSSDSEAQESDTDLDAIFESLGMVKQKDKPKHVKLKKVTTEFTKMSAKANSNFHKYTEIMKRKARCPFDPTKPLSNENPYYVEFNNPDKVEQLFDAISDSGIIGYDIETTGLHPLRQAEILTHQFATTPFTGVLIKQELLDLYPELRERFIAIMEDKNIVKVIQNLKFEYTFISTFFNCDIVNYFDTMIAAHFINENIPNGLKFLANKYLSVDMIEFNEVTYGTKEYDPASTYALEYACADADMALQLYNIFKPIMDKGGIEHELEQCGGIGFNRIFYETSLPIARLLGKMELAGIMYNQGLLRNMQEKTDRLYAYYLNNIHQVAPDLNPDSSHQLAKFLYQECQLPILNYTKGGKSGIKAPATDMKTLKKLSEQFHHMPVLDHLVEYAKLAKFKSSYTDSLWKHLNPNTCAVHTQIHQTRTVTSRFSSSDPNLQNLRKNQDD